MKPLKKKGGQRRSRIRAEEEKRGEFKALFGRFRGATDKLGQIVFG
jgi:hypothetical protein